MGKNTKPSTKDLTKLTKEELHQEMLILFPFLLNEKTDFQIKPKSKEEKEIELQWKDWRADMLTSVEYQREQELKKK